MIICQIFYVHSQASYVPFLIPADDYFSIFSIVSWCSFQRKKPHCLSYPGHLKTAVNQWLSRKPDCKRDQHCFPWLWLPSDAVYWAARKPQLQYHSLPRKHPSLEYVGYFDPVSRRTLCLCLCLCWGWGWGWSSWCLIRIEGDRYRQGDTRATRSETCERRLGRKFLHIFWSVVKSMRLFFSRLEELLQYQEWKLQIPSSIIYTRWVLELDLALSAPAFLFHTRGGWINHHQASLCSNSYMWTALCYLGEIQ